MRTQHSQRMSRRLLPVSSSAIACTVHQGDALHQYSNAQLPEHNASRHRNNRYRHYSMSLLRWQRSRWKVSYAWESSHGQVLDCSKICYPIRARPCQPFAMQGIASWGEPDIPHSRTGSSSRRMSPRRIQTDSWYRGPVQVRPAGPSPRISTLPQLRASPKSAACLRMSAMKLTSGAGIRNCVAELYGLSEVLSWLIICSEDAVSWVAFHSMRCGVEECIEL